VTSKWTKGTGGPSGDEAQNLVTDFPQAFNWQQGDAEYSLRQDASALAADSRPAVLLPQAFDEMNFTTADQHHVLRAGTKQSTEVVEPVTAHETGQGWWNEADHAGTLRAEGENRPSRPSNVAVMQYGVRRLTPVECERLQAFPDGWTEPAGSDSARYKALGNAVTVNTVWWILRRMKEQG
jgi:DNA (cytosine-5)-methyltransferase 1